MLFGLYRLMIADITHRVVNSLAFQMICGIIFLKVLAIKYYF